MGEIAIKCRRCENEAISEKTRYCRSCQAKRVHNWKVKASGPLATDNRWRDYATTINQKVMRKYADRWVAPRKVEL